MTGRPPEMQAIGPEPMAPNPASVPLPLDDPPFMPQSYPSDPQLPPGQSAQNAPYFPPPPNQPFPEAQPGDGLALHVGPESQIADHPASMNAVPTLATTATPNDNIRNINVNCRYGLREYLSLRKKLTLPEGPGSTSNLELENRLRHQSGILMGDLNILQAEVRALAKAAQNHRWRRWLVGGLVATFIPAVRRIFRRGSDEDSELSANDTEYAFRRSKGLLGRIKDGIFGTGALAKVAFFVFAALYIFQNEVTLRVARTLQKRLRGVSAKLERDEALDERDIKVLEGWRWRVLLW